MILPRSIRRELDLPLFAAVCATILIGIMTIYSATYDWELGAAGVVYQKQIIWAMIGLFGLALTIVVPLKYYYAFAYVIYGIAVLSLVLVLELGHRRWFDFGVFYVQPSEFAKIATVLALARYLSKRDLNLDRIRAFVVPLFLVLVPTLLVYRQPDLSTAIVFGVILFPMLFWAGLRLVTIFFIVSPALSMVCAFNPLALGALILVLAGVVFLARPRLMAIVALVVINLTVAVGSPYLFYQKLHDYQRGRILTFLNPDTDKLGAGYQVIQSRVAIGSGGVRGKGYLQGTQTKLAFLPEQHTDFIFAVLGEEFGFIGAIALLALFLFIIWRAVQIASLAKSHFFSLVAIGLATILVFHVFVNIGMTIGVMPVTGLPLPFLSYGGSPLVTNMILVGFLLNIHARRHEYY